MTGQVFSWLTRWPFLAAVALIAATVSDLLVEAIANTGVFGGAYFDTDDSSIVPALSAATILAAGVIAGHMRAACRRSRAGRRDWLAQVADDVATHAPLRDLQSVLSLQFAALYAMESVEQFVGHGRVLGGLLWLGGPPLFSVAAHIAVGLACTLVAGWLIRVSVPRFACLVFCALEFALCARSLTATAIFVIRRSAAACNHAQPACVRRISGRAPPFVAVPA